MLTHGADVELERDHHQHHDQGEDRIEVHRDHLDEGGDGALIGQAMGRHDAPHQGDDVGAPGGDGHQHADRRRGGVQQIGQLGAGDLEAIGDRAADGPHRQAVEEVIDEEGEDHHAGEGLGPLAGLGAALGPLGEGPGRPGDAHQADEAPQQQHEQDHVDVVPVERTVDPEDLEHGVQHVMQGIEGGELVEQQTAGHNTHPQRHQDAAGDDRKGDGQQGGNDGPTGVGVMNDVHDLFAPKDNRWRSTERIKETKPRAGILLSPFR
ncbi:hypothetical protein D3C72_554500 [compost metagenome]